MGKARRVVMGWRENARMAATGRVYGATIPRMERTMNDEKLTEIIARMWIECDPNRGDEPGSGYHPDDLAPLHVNGVEEMRPRWEWFVPRAEATIRYLKRRGLEIRPAEVRK